MLVPFKNTELNPVRTFELFIEYGDRLSKNFVNSAGNKVT